MVSVGVVDCVPPRTHWGHWACGPFLWTRWSDIGDLSNEGDLSNCGLAGTLCSPYASRPSSCVAPLHSADPVHKVSPVNVLSPLPSPLSPLFPRPSLPGGAPLGLEDELAVLPTAHQLTGRPLHVIRVQRQRLDWLGPGELCTTATKPDLVICAHFVAKLWMSSQGKQPPAPASASWDGCGRMCRDLCAPPLPPPLSSPSLPPAPSPALFSYSSLSCYSLPPPPLLFYCLLFCLLLYLHPSQTRTEAFIRIQRVHNDQPII